MSLFALDVELLTNLALIACALVFIIALAFRLGIGMRRRSAEGSDGQYGDWEEEPVEVPAGDHGEGTRAPVKQPAEGEIEPVNLEDGEMITDSEPIIDVKELFTRIAKEEPEVVLASSAEMLKHLRERRAVLGVSQEALERLSMQFGLIETALGRVSYEGEGDSCIISREMMREIVREGFRLVSSKTQ